MQTTFRQGVNCHIWSSQFWVHREQTQGVKLGNSKIANYNSSWFPFLTAFDAFGLRVLRIKCLVSLSQYAIATSKDNANNFTIKQRKYVMVQISSNVIKWVRVDLISNHSPLIDLQSSHIVEWVNWISLTLYFFRKNAMHVCASKCFWHLRCLGNEYAIEHSHSAAIACVMEANVVLRNGTNILQNVWRRGYKKLP